MDVEKQIDKWINNCIEKNIPEFIEASKTISRWKEYTLNSFIDKRYSNGHTEGTNNKIKVLKRVGFYKLWQLDTRLLQEFINKIYVKYGFSQNYMASILKVVKGSLKYACYTLNYITKL